MMFEIRTPNRGFSGVRKGVAFKEGAARTADEKGLDWFRAHGYDVKEIFTVAIDGTKLAAGVVKAEPKAETKKARKE